MGNEAALCPSKGAAKPPFDRARIKTDEIAAHRAGRQLLDDREDMRAADSEVEPPSRELARIAEIDVDALLMLACEIAGLSVQHRDDLVRRNGDRVRETWLAVIESGRASCRESVCQYV